MKINSLSTNVIKIMNELAKSDGLVNLLLIDKDDPFVSARPSDFRKNKQIIMQNDKYCRISPTPFNPEAEDRNKSLIRVYYNNAEFDAEIISESQLHIDIIVSKKLWLIYNSDKDEEQIRPYEIIDLIVDKIGRRSGNPNITVDFTGWQHLAVNTHFDAIRMYAEYFKPEA